MQVEGVGATYGQELDYIFGLPISPVWPHQSYHYTRAESVLSAIVISYWANFVKDGWATRIKSMLGTPSTP